MTAAASLRCGSIEAQRELRARPVKVSLAVSRYNDSIARLYHDWLASHISSSAQRVALHGRLLLHHHQDNDEHNDDATSEQ